MVARLKECVAAMAFHFPPAHGAGLVTMTAPEAVAGSPSSGNWDGGVQPIRITFQ
ncbi:hypothetical protein GCM10009637_25340 [Brevibacterium luteolum]